MWLKEEWWDMLGGVITVHMLEPEMPTGVQESQLLFLFLFLFIISLLTTVQPTPHLWFMEHRRLIKDLHVTSALIFLLPEGLIVQSFCFKLVYGTNAGVAHYGFWHTDVESKH